MSVTAGPSASALLSLASVPATCGHSHRLDSNAEQYSFSSSGRRCCWLVGRRARHGTSQLPALGSITLAPTPAGVTSFKPGLTSSSAPASDPSASSLNGTTCEFLPVGTHRGALHACAAAWSFMTVYAARHKGTRHPKHLLVRMRQATSDVHSSVKAQHAMLA